jgi:predicted RecA/RadA family phage recombinase
LEVHVKNFIQNGNTLTATLTGAVASGQLVLLGNGNLPGVASGTYAAGTPGEYAVRGVFEQPAAAAATGVTGDVAYWDATAGNVTSTAQGNTKIGAYADTKIANGLVARVLLNCLV